MFFIHFRLTYQSSSITKCVFFQPTIYLRFFFKWLLIHLREVERDEREKPFPFTDSLPKCLQWPGWSLQKPELKTQCFRSPREVTGAQLLKQSPAASRGHTAGSWTGRIWSQALQCGWGQINWHVYETKCHSHIFHILNSILSCPNINLLISKIY